MGRKCERAGEGKRRQERARGHEGVTLVRGLLSYDEEEADLFPGKVIRAS
jgi:hypothetical protein